MTQILKFEMGKAYSLILLKQLKAVIIQEKDAVLLPCLIINYSNSFRIMVVENLALSIQLFTYNSILHFVDYHKHILIFYQNKLLAIFLKRLLLLVYATIITKEWNIAVFPKRYQPYYNEGCIIMQLYFSLSIYIDSARIVKCD